MIDYHLTTLYTEMSKAADIRALLAKGEMTKSQIAKATGASYSQVHSLAKQDSTPDTSPAKMTQEQLFDGFWEGSRGVTRYGGCPGCCPDCKRTYWYEGSYHDPVTHERDTTVNLKKCNNCGYILVSPVKDITSRTTPTRTQQHRIEQVRRFLMYWGHPKDEQPEKFEVEPDGRGGFWVSGYSAGNVYNSWHTHVHIGPKGAIEVSDFSSVGSNFTEHMAQMLDGKVNKYVRKSARKSGK